MSECKGVESDRADSVGVFEKDDFQIKRIMAYFLESAGNSENQLTSRD